MSAITSDQPNSTTDPPEPQKDEADAPKDGAQAPYENVVSAVVAKIQNDAFLFVIGIAALLIGFIVTATGVGSSDLLFYVMVIAVLAFLAILGYYILEGMKAYSKQKQEVQMRQEAAQQKKLESDQLRPTISGTVNADDLSDEAQAKGVRATAGSLPEGTNIQGNVDIGKASGRSQAMGVDIDNPEADKPNAASSS